MGIVHNRKNAVAALLFLSSVTLASASNAAEVANIPIVDAPVGTPGLGGGIRAGSIPYIGEEQGSDLVPLYLYEGKYFFAHGTSGGVHLFRNDQFTFDVLARYRFQRLDPGDNPRLAGLHERDQTVDAGIGATLRGNWGKLEASWVADTLGRHEGEEAQLDYSYPIDRGRWLFSPWLNLTWSDETLLDYYFGVDADEVASGRPEYRPTSGTSYGVGINTSYQVSRNLLAFFNLGIFRLDDTIHNSPIVDEDTISVAYLGAAYMFGNVFEPQDTPLERRGEWSWRVNYGYQAEGNISTDNLTGDLSSSSLVDTNVGGVTLSRLVIAGPRVDMYARFALFRHFESEYQDNFWSYTPYLMAMGKGYFPWREKVAFRFGFGMGFSYAERVPMQEQVKQANKGKETSHFLNYLEWTVDVPVDSFIKSKSVRDCYVGLTDVHRSGIFATADILGNVAGGSDWITFHVECLR